MTTPRYSAQEQDELVTRVEKSTRIILVAYNECLDFLHSFDEFRAAVGLAQISAGLTQEIWDKENDNN